ncbi:hypothetical protein ABN028_12145 [Actinopolymorpha sp. B17G11]|uniref:hypothetical protein n=1 Tax=Actinopolymorpha sp. B17G11 TaxID=3160861 RepID=UPI0032E439CC
MRKETDYAGAVYGSLLAAAVVVGAGADGTPLAPTDLAIALVGTGVVFWAAHVYARVVGERPRPGSPGAGSRSDSRTEAVSLTAQRVGDVARREWPMVEAALPPAAVALIGGFAGFPAGAVTWAALGIAVAGQVGWAMVAAAAAGVRRRGVAASGVGNLVLGLLIVLLEVGLH